MATAAILTIGNELLSGDVPNTNASWLAKRLESLGVTVRLLVALPDEIDTLATWIRDQAPAFDFLLVTGGLGGTPDDVTREAVAAAFAAPQEEIAEVAERLRARFTRDPDYVTRWTQLPRGSRPFENPLGGAPGFVLENVYVLPGLPSEMEAMFDSIAEEFRRGESIASWRRTYRTTESRIVGVLEQMEERHPAVLVGSYPSFLPEGSEVEVVVKSHDRQAHAAAVAWIEAALAEVTG